jgi:hypothetical protein
MFQQKFKNIDDILHKDAGCGGQLNVLKSDDYKLLKNLF